MALVTDQFNCERIIKAAKALADRSSTALTVVHVGNHSTSYNPEAIEYLFRISAENGAVMSIQYSDNPEAALGGLIRAQLPSRIVTGMPQADASPLQKLWIRFPQIAFFTVDLAGNVNPVTFSDTINMEVGV